jgi:hypothetical protein
MQENLQKELEETKRQLWMLVYWMTVNLVPYSPYMDCDKIIDNWELNGLNPKGVTKYKEYKRLQERERCLEEKLRGENK